MKKVLQAKKSAICTVVVDRQQSNNLTGLKTNLMITINNIHQGKLNSHLDTGLKTNLMITINNIHQGKLNSHLDSTTKMF